VSEERDCLDIVEFSKLKDNEAIQVIQMISGFSDIKIINRMQKEERNRLLKEIKTKGLSTRQIARLTGVNRNAIIGVKN